MTAGNFLWVDVFDTLNGSSSYSLYDGEHDSFNLALDAYNPWGTNTVTSTIFYAANILGGSNTVTVSTTLSAYIRVSMAEYSGVAPSNPLDTANEASGTTNFASSGSGTTSGADLVTGSFQTYQSNADWAVSSPFLAITPSSVSAYSGFLTEYLIQASSGSTSSTATEVAGNTWPWMAQMASFKPVPSAILSVTTSTSLVFSAAHGSTASSSEPVMITNTAGASTTLSWSATSTQSWLTFSSASGSLSGGASTSISFIANPSGLAIGTYDATATISDPNALDSPRSLPVSLTISNTNVSTTISSPINGATVSNTVSIMATATSTAPIASVQFYLDGSALGSPIVATSSPDAYSYAWNTVVTANGSHALYVLATDIYGNTASSSQISVTVNNTVPVPVSVSVGVAASYGPPGWQEDSYQAPAPPASPPSAQTSSPELSTSSLQTEFSSLMAEFVSLEREAAATASSSQPNSLSPYVFTRNLALYSIGNDVHSLQLFLVRHNAGPAAQRLAAHGTSDTFGMLTLRALKEFQGSVGITPASGYFGPITRGYANSHG